MERKFTPNNLNTQGALTLQKRTFLVVLGLALGWSNMNASDLLVSGDLEVTGVAEIFGDVLTLGSSGIAIDAPGLSIIYSDSITSGNSTFSLLEFTATRPSHQWLWQHSNDDHTANVPAMKLDENHVLTIYDKWGAPSIVLDPSEASGLVGVLTQGAADDRYVKNSDLKIDSEFNSIAGPSALALGAGAAFGLNAFAHQYATAMGYGANASAHFSVALGTFASAPGSYGMALGGYAYASGFVSAALGHGASAYAHAGLGLGYEARVYGKFGTAVGFKNVSIGRGATAAGIFTRAAGYRQFVVGAFNVPQGNPDSWVETDDLFIVGNGNSPLLDGNGFPIIDPETGDVLAAVPSNAFVVKKNGDTVVYGRLNSSGGAAVGDQSTAIGEVTAHAYKGVVVGSWNDADSNESSSSWSEVDPIFVVGNGKDENHRSNALVVRKSGDVEMMAKVKMPRQGDILMGEFGNPEP